ncbi:MAG: hypothetical protein ACJ796_20375 [Gemmatimonadaceae bacterium]
MMTRSHFRLIRLLALTLTPCVAVAQDSSDVKQQSERRADATPAVTAGVTTGSMSFADHRVQQGVTGVLRYHVGSSISVAASPTYARMTYPASLGGGSVSALTDLPIELSLDRAIGVVWTPTLGLSLGTTLPVGNERLGFGSGAVGASIGAGLGLSPTDVFSLHVGVGAPLTDYRMVGALGSSGSTWGDFEVSSHLLDRFDATIGFDGDFATSDSLGPARAVAFSLAASVAGPFTMTLSGGHGVSGAAARWTVALGFGTDFAGFQAIGSSSPIQRFLKAMGGSSHRGSGSANSGHGRGP